MSGLSGQSHESQVSNSTASANSHNGALKVNGVGVELNERHEQELEDEEAEYSEVCRKHAYTCAFVRLSPQPIRWH